MLKKNIDNFATILCLTETQLIGIISCSHLREGSEGKCALHLANVIVQDSSRTESLRKLKAVHHLQRLANRL